jgi:hypothetical protein
MIKLRDIHDSVIKNPIPPYKIYCDMDGVLCDFEKRFEDLTGESPKSFKGTHGINEFWKVIDNDGVKFWRGMPWMPDGQILYNYIKKYNPTLLSSPSWDESSKIGKRLWVKKHTPGTKLILVPRMYKQDYSLKKRILIDDLEVTIEEWNAKGGIGILHTSASSTIGELKKLGL